MTAPARAERPAAPVPVDVSWRDRSTDEMRMDVLLRVAPLPSLL